MQVEELLDLEHCREIWKYGEVFMCEIFEIVIMMKLQSLIRLM